MNEELASRPCAQKALSEARDLTELVAQQCLQNLSAPLPLKPNSKKLAMRGDANWKLSPSQLWERYFEYCEGHGIDGAGWALRLDELLVVDCDSIPAVTWVRENLPLTVEVETKRGVHFYFRPGTSASPPASIENGNIVIHVLVGRKARVVMPGTSAEGHTYRYVPGASPAQRQLAVLGPEDVRRLTELVAESSSASQDEKEHTRLFPGSDIPVMLQGVRKGHRDQTCTFLVAHVLYRRNGDPDEIMEIMLMWNERNKPPWGQAREESSPEDWIADKIRRLGKKMNRESSSWTTKNDACLDALIRFVAELCKLGPEYRIKQSLFYSAVLAWLKENGLGPFTRTRIGQTLKGKFPIRESVYRNLKKGIKGRRDLLGITLR